MKEATFGSLPLAFSRSKQVCEKHGVGMITSPRFEGVLCPECEREAIHLENQVEVDRIADELDEQRRLYYIKELSMYDDTLENASFENFDTPTEAESEKKEWALERTRDWFKGARNNVILRGRAGTGKSHLAFSMLKTISDHTEKKALFVNVPTLVDKSMADNFAKKNYYIDQLKQVDYLVLDDLGKELKMPFARLMIYEILNARSNTIITTNLTDKELINHYDDAAIVRRIKKGVQKDNGWEMEFNDLTNKGAIYF